MRVCAPNTTNSGLIYGLKLGSCVLVSVYIGIIYIYSWGSICAGVEARSTMSFLWARANGLGIYMYLFPSADLAMNIIPSVAELEGIGRTSAVKGRVEKQNG